MLSFTIRLASGTREATISCPGDTPILQILQAAQQKWSLSTEVDYAINLKRTGRILDSSITLNLSGIYNHDVLEMFPNEEGGGMILQSLIIEQLEVDGTLKTFRMHSEPNSEIVVAFADEYEEPREGPVYFLDKEYSETFRKGFAKCESRRLGKTKFRYLDNQYEINISWRGITTKANELSLYSLSLPIYAVPQFISIGDLQNPPCELRRNVVKDEQHNRFLIYLECRSKYGVFDFNLNCQFSIDKLNFSSAQYKDSLTENNYYQNILKFALKSEEEVKVQEFLDKSVLPNNINLSIYNIHNSQFAGGIVDANNINVQKIGGNIQNSDT